jgi:hypothetical protein
MKLKGDALTPRGTEQELMEMARLKRSELAEIEKALALVKTRKSGKEQVK